MKLVRSRNVNWTLIRSSSHAIGSRVDARRKVAGRGMEKNISVTKIRHLGLRLEGPRMSVGLGARGNGRRVTASTNILIGNKKKQNER